jgi:glutamate/tyrosine decarboxylase-like PLP-dependent enzyme
VWAALRSLGRCGVADLVDRLVDNARAITADVATAVAAVRRAAAG